MTTATELVEQLNLGGWYWTLAGEQESFRPQPVMSARLERGKAVFVSGSHSYHVPIKAVAEVSLGTVRFGKMLLEHPRLQRAHHERRWIGAGVMASPPSQDSLAWNRDVVDEVCRLEEFPGLAADSSGGLAFTSGKRTLVISPCIDHTGELCLSLVVTASNGGMSGRMLVCSG